MCFYVLTFYPIGVLGFSGAVKVVHHNLLDLVVLSDEFRELLFVISKDDISMLLSFLVGRQVELQSTLRAKDLPTRTLQVTILEVSFVNISILSDELPSAVHLAVRLVDLSSVHALNVVVILCSEVSKNGICEDALLLVNPHVIS